RTGRGDHAAPRRKAPADAHRTAQEPRRYRDGQRVFRSLDAAFRAGGKRPVHAWQGRTVPGQRPAARRLTHVPVLSELRLGTRGSQLALWQARAVAARIAATGGPPCRLVTIKTSGDRIQDAPL